MDWALIRMHFATLHAAAGLTQKAIAERGGLAGQNAISKLLNNTNLGPSVDTFVRALVGLGQSPAAFFAEVEALARGADSSSTAALDTTAPLSAGRPPDADPPLSPHELEQFAARLHATLHQLAGTLAALPSPLAAARPVPDLTPRVRAPRRRRARQMA